MIVLDASAAVELLLHTAAGAKVAARLDIDESIHVPHLIDVEIAQALRRLVTRSAITVERATRALRDWANLDVERHAHEPFLRRIWNLRDNFSAYDAAYIALAEILRAPLVTTDRRLVRAPGVSTRIECFDS